MFHRQMLTVVTICLGSIAVATVQAQDAQPQLTRALRNNWIRCSIVGGRVAVDSGRLNNAAVDSTTPGVVNSEKLSIRNENGQCLISYSQTTNNEQIALQSGADASVTIRRSPRGASTRPAAEFVQKNNEKLTFILGEGAHKQVYRELDIWTLLLVQPKQSQTELVSLLEMLRLDWRLAEMVANIETQLIAEAGNPNGDRRSRWTEFVAQLSDDRFARRESADRALRDGGLGALAYLRQLDFARLDAEQQFRIRRILDASSEQNGDDTIEQTTTSLAEEPLVWLALLARPEKAMRQAAVRQLSALLGEPIAVDPEAAPESQKAQREQLRTRIEGK